MVDQPDAATLARMKLLLDKAGGAISFHYILNYKCDVEGDDAHVEIYWLFTTREREENSWLAGGRYWDRFERRGGEWKIALRCNLMEWTGQFPGGALPFGHVADLHANGAPARKADPYRRPLDNRRAVSVG